jgi:hemoglobin
MFVHLETHADTLFERVGGEPFFKQLVERFYAGVATDAALRSLYPADLEPPTRHLTLFLMQYWGGPRTYTEQRGQPRLRMRHFPFRIGQRERDAWLSHMRQAVKASDAAPADVEALLAYFETAATSLINEPAASL